MKIDLDVAFDVTFSLRESGALMAALEIARDTLEAVHQAVPSATRKLSDLRSEVYGIEEKLRKLHNERVFKEVEARGGEV